MDKTKAKNIVDNLSQVFPDKPALNFSSPFELLIAVMLSAQCTDERVNKVTAVLFKDYDDPQSFAEIDVEVLKKYIFSCGLYKTKAEHIISASRDIVEKFGGQVPDNLEDLRTLAGVGRKTANVVYAVAFHGDAIAVDTHVFRVSKRIGLAKADNVLGVEKELMKILDRNVWSKAHHYLIYLGRSYCKAGNPNCEGCPINNLCEKKIIKKGK